MAAYELRSAAPTELKLPPGHARRAPTAAAYRKLKAGLAAFGPVLPLVWNETTGHLVDGAARLGALAELGVAEVPVSVVRLSAAREQALALLLNNPKAQARFDAARLAAALATLDAADLALTGFDRRTARGLRFEPTPAAALPKPERVEVTLVADEATFAALAGRLDALISEHQLVAHVRRA